MQRHHDYNGGGERGGHIVMTTTDMCVFSVAFVSFLILFTLCTVMIQSYYSPGSITLNPNNYSLSYNPLGPRPLLHFSKFCCLINSDGLLCFNEMIHLKLKVTPT